jgi:sulfatase maturation enzyme AslB (radical SAM superfamily)
MDPRNFNWIGTWSLTKRCNLRCTYCSGMKPANHDEGVDYAESLARIGSVRPKVLNISGGEPTLIAELPWILREAKTRWNPFTRVVTNGTNLDLLDECIPHLDKLVVSLDAPGALNRKTKGLDGDLVTKRIRQLVERTARASGTCSIWVNSTMTLDNYMQAGEMVDQLSAISPDIFICLSPVMPPDGPTSIMTDQHAWDGFWSQYQRIRATHTNVAAHFEHFASPTPPASVCCYVRCFWVTFDAFGNAKSCVPHYVAETDTYGFDCQAPCNCEGWFDFYLRGQTCDSTTAFLDQFTGRLTPDEIDDAHRFITRHINPAFERRSLEMLASGWSASAQRVA